MSGPGTRADAVRPTRAKAVAVGTTGPHIDVILLTREGNRFLLRSDGARLRCPRLTPRGMPDQKTLPGLVERLLAEQFGIEASFLGLLAGDTARHTLGLVVAAVAPTAQLTTTGDPALRLLSLDDISRRADDVDHATHFANVQRWWRAEETATGLSAAIQRAFATSIAFLDNHLSIEDGHWGWNLYQDGSAIGMLSTAEAVLAHVYAGARGEFVNKPAETLEAMQNPDGGWRIRRSLVAAHSELSITESTSACLRALGEIGRSAASPSVGRGIAWLVEQQRPDGGWSSSAEAEESLVFPTTAAVRALAGLGRIEAVTEGLAWLRAAQSSDGGWGAYSRAADRGMASSPAYTGYVIVAMLSAGLQTGDPVVVRGCEYLESTFEPARAEPWEPTSFNTLVDSTTSARMEFRHFSTPWALAALVMAGYDLGNRVVMDAMQRLMSLQEPNGTWRCGLNAPGSAPVWATHDALFALRLVAQSGSRDLAPIALAPHLAAERAAAGEIVAGVLGSASDRQPTRSRRNWLHTAWMSVLTVSVALLFLAQFGVLDQLVTSSGLQQVGAAVASVIVTVAGAIAPSIVAEEYKIRRQRKTGG